MIPVKDDLDRSAHWKAASPGGEELREWLGQESQAATITNFLFTTLYDYVQMELFKYTKETIKKSPKLKYLLCSRLRDISCLSEISKF